MRDRKPLMLSIAFPPKPVQVSAVMGVGDSAWAVVEQEFAQNFEHDGHSCWLNGFAGPDAAYLPDESKKIGFQRYPEVGAG